LLYPILPKTLADRRRAGQPEEGPLRLRVEPRRQAGADRTRLTHRWTALPKTSFPQAREGVGDWRQAAAGKFLLRWPSWAAVPQARRSERRRFSEEPRRLSPEERAARFR